MSLEVTPHHFHFVQLVGRKPRSPAHTEGSTFSKEDQSIFFTSVVRLVEHNSGPGSFPSLSCSWHHFLSLGVLVPLCLFPQSPLLRVGPWPGVGSPWGPPCLSG